jgi:hypothetical protein
VTFGSISARNTRSELRCYAVRLLHELLEDDTVIKLQFCELFPNEYSPDIVMKMICPDQVDFKLSGHVNKNNCVSVRMLLIRTLRLKPFSKTLKLASPACKFYN